MARTNLAVRFLYCASLTTASIGFVKALPQAYPEENRAALSILTSGWGPLTSENEIVIAGYLKNEAEAYLRSLEGLRPERFKDRTYASGETAHTLELTVSDLEVSLKEIITTLGLIEKMFRQRPADYIQSAPLLWLTVVKDLSLDRAKVRELDRLGLVKAKLA